MISTASTDYLTVHLTWTEVRNLIAALHAESADNHGIDDDEQEEMITIVNREEPWITSVITDLNDALAENGQHPWQRDPG